MTQIFQNERVTQYLDGNTIIQVNNHRRNDPIIFLRTPDRTAGLVQPDAPIEALGLATQSGPEPMANAKSPMPEHPSGECSREQNR